MLRSCLLSGFSYIGFLVGTRLFHWDRRIVVVLAVVSFAILTTHFAVTDSKQKDQALSNVFSAFALYFAVLLEGASSVVGAISWKESLVVSHGVFCGLPLGGLVVWQMFGFSGVAPLVVGTPHGMKGALWEMPTVTMVFQASSLMFIVLSIPWILPLHKPLSKSYGETKSASWQRMFMGACWSLGLVVQYLALKSVLPMEPIVWVATFVAESPGRLLLIFYWIIWLGIMVFCLRPESHCGATLRRSLPNIAIRKIFHLIAVAMFVPGVLSEHRCMQLAFVVALEAVILLEILRVTGNSGAVHDFMTQFTGTCSPGVW